MLSAVKNLENVQSLTLKIEEVAQLLGVGRGTAYNLAKRPDFPSIRVGARLIVPKHLFFEWLEKNAAKPVE